MLNYTNIFKETEVKLESDHRYEHVAVHRNATVVRKPHCGIKNYKATEPSITIRTPKSVIIKSYIYVKNVDILKVKNVIKEEAENILTNVTPVIIGGTATISK